MAAACIAGSQPGAISQPAHARDRASSGRSGLVWARELEQAGLARVIYDPRTLTLTFIRGNVRLTMRAGSRTAQVNGIGVSVRRPAAIVNGRAMVPKRFVLDALGLQRANTTARTARSAQQVGALITGRVLYAGQPAAGVALRLVRARDFTFVPGIRARSDARGMYRFTGVPSGAYCVYVYVGDNPAYFNRATPGLNVADDEVAAADIHLGRVLRPAEPPQDAILSPAADFVFAWQLCPRAVEYALSVVDPATNEEVFSTVTRLPHAVVDLSLMKPGREYIWRVTASDSRGAFLGGSPGAGAEPWRFSLTIK
jgi:hypothetical protein